MLKIIYKGKDLKKIKKDILKTFDSVKVIFKIQIPEVVINIYENRSDFNKKLKKETTEWLVANASNNNEIDILSPKAMDDESSHNKREFLQILKHEFTHLYIHKLSKGNTVPKWLNEGLASYVAKQNQDSGESLYIEEKFCKKLGTSKGWNDNVNYSAYKISSLFVKFLIKKYSFKKIQELLASLEKNYYYPNFQEIFFKIYNISLKDMEISFIAEINK